MRPASPKPSERSRSFPGRFYPIIDTAACARHGLEPVALAEACLRAGARILQLRAKEAEADSGALLALADAVVLASRTTSARVIINDRADIARMSGADGVHVGQDDLPVAAIRDIVGPGAIVGISTHDEAQVDAALLQDVDYVAVGPVYGTATKDTGYPARGLGLVRYAAARGTPVVAIGGITLARMPEVVAAGATAVAVITDLFVGDPGERARAFVSAHV